MRSPSHPAPFPRSLFGLVTVALRHLVCGVLAVLLAGSTDAGEASFTGTAVEVLAGDLLVVRHGALRVPVRLAGIDAPEQDEPFGTLARQHASALALGRVVIVHVLGTDPRARTVGVAVLPDGRDLGREMVAAGLARWDRRSAPEADLLKALEAEARAAGRGLWHGTAPLR